jgi:hypothetical protein
MHLTITQNNFINPFPTPLALYVRSLHLSSANIVTEISRTEMKLTRFNHVAV